ncbi:hypothetical protein [Thermoanaerobacter sp. RKWS2]|uniref:hypothetical protein n=1 Tax=Thermoanaerobacter sp. RKWS2 TaxID=2983842 RepID=UPI00224AF049|nr:hypothetical protein [Thermoanaerobacter sp. RKWS2]UZQ81818.1 hypothetical protein OEI98_001557 [Thermoanaerobacter sp. RKWS2]
MLTPVFVEFAVTAAFNTQEFQDFINQTKNEERQKEQTLISNRHNDTNPHTDNNPHTDQSTYNQYSQHTDSGYPHTDSSTHSDYYNPHSNYTPHTDAHTNRTWLPHTNNPNAHYDEGSGTHTDVGHKDGYSHINNGYYQGHYNAEHTDIPGHNNGTAHYDRYGQDNYHTDTWGQHTDYYPHTDSYNHTNYPSTHSDTTNHTDTIPHTDQTQHTDYTTHTDIGFDHDDYVPSSPAFYVPYTRLKGDVIIGLYSYDKNTDGYGTQDARSKTVYYDLYIRKVKNLDGTPNTSQWVPLLTNQIQDQDGAVTYTLNTIDPLKVGNTKVGAYDGYYEIKAVARNQSLNGVTFESPEKVVTVLIQQNAPPEITVQNGAEFINFIFGFNGALTTSNIYKPYGGLYADGKIPVHTDTPASPHIDASVPWRGTQLHIDQPGQPHIDAVTSQTAQSGILVKFTMLDADNPNWQKGQIYLVDENGVPVAGTVKDIVWENGSTVISSNGTPKVGYGYIPKESYTALNKSMKNMKVVIKVQDYTDAQCTNPAGAAVIQTAVSQQDPTQMIVHLDLTPPQAALVNITKQNDKSKVVNYKFVDDFPDIQKGIKNGGIKEAKYVLAQTTARPQDWTSVSSPDSAQTVISEEGIWYLHYYASDMLLNETYGYWGPIIVDKTAPVIEASYSPQGTSVIITAKATDNLSGVKYLSLYDGTNLIATYTNSSSANPFTATFTVPAVEKTYKVVAEDNEGNTAEQEVAVILLNLVNNTTKTTYAAGEAMRISVISPQAERVTAQVWYSKNEFVNTNVTDLVKGANGEWHTRQGGSEGYDKVVIIPKDTKDGTYSVVVTAYRGTQSKSITIPITVKNTIYDYYKSTITK